MSDAKNDLVVAMVLSYVSEVLDLHENEEAIKNELDQLLRENHPMLRCSGSELEEGNRKMILDYFTSWCVTGGHGVVDVQAKASKQKQQLDLSRLLSAPSSTGNIAEEKVVIEDDSEGHSNNTGDTNIAERSSFLVCNDQPPFAFLKDKMVQYTGPDDMKNGKLLEIGQVCKVTEVQFCRMKVYANNMGGPFWTEFTHWHMLKNDDSEVKSSGGVICMATKVADSKEKSKIKVCLTCPLAAREDRFCTNCEYLLNRNYDDDVMEVEIEKPVLSCRRIKVRFIFKEINGFRTSIEDSAKISGIGQLVNDRRKHKRYKNLRKARDKMKENNETQMMPTTTFEHAASSGDTAIQEGNRVMVTNSFWYHYFSNQCPWYGYCGAPPSSSSSEQYTPSYMNGYVLPPAMEFTTWPSTFVCTPPPGLEHLTEVDITEEITASTFENDDTPPPVLKEEQDLSASTFENDDTPPPVLKEEHDLCIICMEVPRKFAFVPCGHLIICSGCAKKYKPGDQCCMCRREIENIIEIFK